MSQEAVSGQLSAYPMAKAKGLNIDALRIRAKLSSVTKALRDIKEGVGSRE